MPVHLQPLDLANNLDRDMAVINSRGKKEYYIFYIDGTFSRIRSDSRKGQEYAASHIDCLVGVYSRTATRQDIKDDINYFREQVALQCRRHVKAG